LALSECRHLHHRDVDFALLVQQLAAQAVSKTADRVLGAVTMTVILLMTPAAYHRIVFAGQDAEEVRRIGSLFIKSPTVPLALGLAGDVYVVLAEITGSSEVAGFIAAVTPLSLVGRWHLSSLSPVATTPLQRRGASASKSRSIGLVTRSWIFVTASLKVVTMSAELPIVAFASASSPGANPQAPISTSAPGARRRTRRTR
jgi:Family of unknown function (DUF6328)